ncbi:MAG: 3-oxoacyl-ACP synthase, partial [Ornithinibacter sp.]
MITTKGFASSLRASAPAQHSRMLGIGGYRPRRVVPNSELVERIDSSDEWIRERSGIIERRFAGEGESVIDMSVFAATPALEMAGISAQELDVVIVATISWP